SDDNPRQICPLKVQICIRSRYAKFLRERGSLEIPALILPQSASARAPGTFFALVASPVGPLGTCAGAIRKRRSLQRRNRVSGGFICSLTTVPELARELVLSTPQPAAALI